MAGSSFWPRLLTALAGSTPAFAEASAPAAGTRSRRLLSALAGSSPAFVPPDPVGPGEFRSALVPLAERIRTLPVAERLAARTAIDVRRLDNVMTVADAVSRARFVSIDGVPDGSLVSALTAAMDAAGDHDSPVGAAYEEALAADRLAVIVFNGHRRQRELLRSEMRVLERDIEVARARDAARALVQRGPDKEEVGLLEQVADALRNLVPALDASGDGSMRDRAVALAGVIAKDATGASTLTYLEVEAFMDLLERWYDPAELSDVPVLRERLARTRSAYDAVGDELARVTVVAAAIHRGASALRSALSSVEGEDLTGLRIDDRVRLDGLRWTESTRWPAGWQDWVREHSREIGHGVYVLDVRPSGGTATSTVGFPVHT